MAERRNKVVRCALILLGIGALYALIVRHTGFGVPCPINLATGLKCPGCGVTGMCLSLIRLDFGSAFRHNAAIFCLLPLMAATLGRYIYLYIRRGKVKDRFIDISEWSMIAVLLVFGVARNILPYIN